MKKLSEYEWAVLREMACSLLSNAVEHELPNGSYWEVSDTIVEHERKLLRKLSGGDVKGLKKALGLFDIALLDHVIIGDKEFYSFATEERSRV